MIYILILYFLSIIFPGGYNVFDPSVSPVFLVQQNFLKLCSNKGIIIMCISTGNFDSIFYLGVTPFFNLEIWPKEKIQFVSANPLKPLNRILWNFVVIKDIPCICAYSQEILIHFFSGRNSPFWTEKFDQNERYYSKQFVSTTPLKLLSSRYAFLQEMLI